MSYAETDCCGQHEVCERLPEVIHQKIEYFDDEELDLFSGIASDRHTESAVEEFREVLYTLRPNEVIDWLTSLQLRNINLPGQLVDEAFLIVEEQLNKG
jgi:hypothetical protein